VPQKIRGIFALGSARAPRAATPPRRRAVALAAVVVAFLVASLEVEASAF